MVAGKDEFTGVLTYKPVTHLFSYDDDRTTYDLVLKDVDGDLETLEVTDNHPFNVVGKGWLDSIDLVAGMQVPSVDDGLLTVVSLTPLEASPVTYNFTVADFHTYFVGEMGAWVHNTNPRCDCIFETPGGTYYYGVKNISPSKTKLVDSLQDTNNIYDINVERKYINDSDGVPVPRNIIKNRDDLPFIADDAARKINGKPLEEWNYVTKLNVINDKDVPFRIYYEKDNHNDSDFEIEVNPFGHGKYEGPHVKVMAKVRDDAPEFRSAIIKTFVEGVEEQSNTWFWKW